MGRIAGQEAVAVRTFRLMGERLSELAEHERPRERLAEHGPEALRDAELVALVLRHGHAGASALEVAERLLKDYGGLVGLAAARTADLERRAGMGPALGGSVVAACQLAVRIRAEEERVPLVRSVIDVADLAIPLLQHCRTHRVVAFVVDGSAQLRRAVTIADDGIALSPVLVREVLTTVLHHGGGAVALASSHPDGDAAPTEVDRLVADGVATGARSVGLGFIGAVTVAGRLWEEVPVPAPPASTPG
ncbi:MAG: repair protein [Ilumatobacteraceae bacterium]|nr:repair protein [Ilumatobacteraceae bacterium]